MNKSSSILLTLVSGLWAYNVKAQSRFYEDDAYFMPSQQVHQPVKANYKDSLNRQLPIRQGNLHCFNFRFNFYNHYFYNWGAPGYSNYFPAAVPSNRYNGLRETSNGFGNRGNNISTHSSSSSGSGSGSGSTSSVTKPRSGSQRNGFGSLGSKHSVAS